MAARSAAAHKAAATTTTTTSASDPPIASAWPPLARLTSEPTLPVDHPSSPTHSLRSLSITLANDVTSAEVHIHQQVAPSRESSFPHSLYQFELSICIVIFTAYFYVIVTYSPTCKPLTMRTSTERAETGSSFAAILVEGSCTPNIFQVTSNHV